MQTDIKLIYYGKTKSERIVPKINSWNIQLFMNFRFYPGYFTLVYIHTVACIKVITTWKITRRYSVIVLI